MACATLTETMASQRVPPSEQWPEDALERVAACPFCESAERRTLHRDLYDVTFFCAPGGFKMERCGECGSGYLDPRPTPTSLGRAYAAYYTHTARPGLAPRQSRLGRLREALANGYRNHRFGSDLKPALRVGVPLILAMPRRRAQIEAYCRHLPRRPGVVMDFGCGEGAFLNVARQLGWRALGIDFDPVAVATAQARGFAVEQGGEECVATHQEEFDYITISHVVEHVPDPKALLLAAFGALRPGGGLFIETPNLAAYCHERFGRHWRGLEAPRHLQIPTWRGLEALVNRAGFTEVRRHPRPEIFEAMRRKSAAIEAGLDPEDPDDMARFAPPADERAAAARDPDRVEYVTVTARRPSIR